MTRAEKLYDVLRLVRPIHQASARLVTESLADRPVTMPMRAVLEQVHDGGPRTVPQVARALWLTRQAVQKIVDDAVALGYLELRDNPEHRRSRLVALTETGTALYDDLHRAELARLGRIAAPLPAADIEACVRVLTHLSSSVRDLLTDTDPTQEEH